MKKQSLLEQKFSELFWHMYLGNPNACNHCSSFVARHSVTWMIFHKKPAKSKFDCEWCQDMKVEPIPWSEVNK